MRKFILMVMFFCFGAVNAAETLGVTVAVHGVKIYLNSDWKMVHQGKDSHGEPEFTLQRDGIFKEDQIYIYHSKNLLRAIKNRPSFKGAEVKFKRGYGFMLNFPIQSSRTGEGDARFYNAMIPGTGVYIMVNDLDLLNQVEVIGIKQSLLQNPKLKPDHVK